MSQAIKKKATAIQKALEKEKQTYGFINDGRGKRYQAALLLLEIEDYKGLLKYYDWFYAHFPDDIGFPELHLSWVYTALNTGQDALLHKHLVELEDINTYVLPKLLGQPVERVEKWEGSNLETEEYADYLLEKHVLRELLTPEVKARLLTISQSEVYQSYKQRFLAYQVEIDTLPVGPKRSRALQKRDDLLEDWVKALGA